MPTLLDKLAKVVTILTCITVIYYLVVYIPRLEQEKLDKQIQEQKQADYKDCMEKAEKNYKVFWASECKHFNEPDADCALSIDAGRVLWDSRMKSEEICSSIFKSK